MCRLWGVSVHCTQAACTRSERNLYDHGWGEVGCFFSAAHIVCIEGTAVTLGRLQADSFSSLLSQLVHMPYIHVPCRMYCRIYMTLMLLVHVIQSAHPPQTQ